MGYVYGQLIRAAVETLGADPSTNADKFTGRLWYNTATNLLKYADASNNIKVLLTSGDVVNADINAAAAIAYSKLNLSGSIVNADVNASAAIAYSKLNLATSIVNADIAAAAAIAFSKMENLTTGRALVSDGSGDVSVATTTATEIGYVNGVTSAIQTQLDAKQARSTLTTKGDIYVASASATVGRLGVTTNGFVLTADSGESLGVKWAAQGAATIETGSTTDTVGSTTTHYLADTSGGSWTLTLRAGTLGSKLTITKITNDLSILTIDGDGTEEIREGGTSATTTTINTPGESVDLLYDGTRWEVVARKTTTRDIAYTPTFAGLGAVANLTAFYSRRGNKLKVHARWENGTVTGDLASLTLPAGIAIDTTVLPTTGNFLVGAWARNASSSVASGRMVSSTGTDTGKVYFGSSFGDSGSSPLSGELGTGFTGNSEVVVIEFEVPITGWKA
jgi:hypothetical protein